MKLSTLHSHVRASVRRVVSRHYKTGIRFVLESGSVEGFLRDLLAIELKTCGYSPIREHRTESGSIVDLVLKGASPEYVEAKQLHLKDGAQFVKNVVKDLKRHARRRCFGVIYVVDDPESRLKMERPSHDGKNRNAKHGVPVVMKALNDNFDHVYPHAVRQARVRRFKGVGRLDLYAFVVQ